MSENSQEKKRILELAGVHAEEITKSFNPQELLAILVENAVLCDEERKLIAGTCRRKQRRQLFECFRRSPETFIQCLENEKTHSGHRYILALVREEVFAIQSQIKKSKEYEERVFQRKEELVCDIDMNYLLPVLLGQELLTLTESEEIEAQRTCAQKSAYLLNEILPSKGPLAYLKFVNCLGEEHNVPRHAELFEYIVGHKPKKRFLEVSFGSESDDETPDHGLTDIASECKAKRRAIINSPQEPLAGAVYEAIMKVLWEGHHGGDWDVLETEAGTLLNTDSTDSQLKIVVLLEFARSHIFRKNWELVDKHTQSAKSHIEQLFKEDIVNAAYLSCQTELILSLKYLFFGDFQKAQQHLGLAKESLFNGDIQTPFGEYAARLSYCSGCIRLEKLHGLSERDACEESPLVVNDFKAVLYYAQLDNSYDSTRVHAYLRLAQFYLNCSHFTAGRAKNQENIDQAQHYLQQVQVSSLLLRSQAIYYITSSDLARSTSARDEAKVLAQKALDIANNAGFLTEKDAAIRRLDALDGCHQL